MARFPGTETPTNRAGWKPGSPVRCRRSQANASRELADRRGFVVEVRPSHARVLLDATGRSLWLENEALLPEEELGDPELERLRAVFVTLGGLRLEAEEDALVVLGEGYEAAALDEVRALLGARLRACRVQPHGVHEVATRLELAPPD